MQLELYVAKRATVKRIVDASSVHYCLHMMTIIKLGSKECIAPLIENC